MMMEYGMNAWSLVSTIMNLLLGGGFLITFITLRAQRKKASAEADGAQAFTESTELDNVEKAITIWREMAERLRVELTNSNARYEDLARQVEALRRDVQKLNYTNQKILKLLDKISHENLETTVAEIKNEIKKSDA